MPLSTEKILELVVCSHNVQQGPQKVSDIMTEASKKRANMNSPSLYQVQMEAEIRTWRDVSRWKRNNFSRAPQIYFLNPQKPWPMIHYIEGEMRDFILKKPRGSFRKYEFLIHDCSSRHRAVAKGNQHWHPNATPSVDFNRSTSSHISPDQLNSFISMFAKVM